MEVGRALEKKEWSGRALEKMEWSRGGCAVHLGWMS
jgi:hypothetical protein